jgi:hypothetical protein
LVKREPRCIGPDRVGPGPSWQGLRAEAANCVGQRRMRCDAVMARVPLASRVTAVPLPVVRRECCNGKVWRESSASQALTLPVVRRARELLRVDGQQTGRRDDSPKGRVSVEHVHIARERRVRPPTTEDQHEVWEHGCGHQPPRALGEDESRRLIKLHRRQAWYNVIAVGRGVGNGPMKSRGRAGDQFNLPPTPERRDRRGVVNDVKIQNTSPSIS